MPLSVATLTPIESKVWVYALVRFSISLHRETLGCPEILPVPLTVRC